MKNKSEKSRWISILKRDLIQSPLLGRSEYQTVNNVIITITSRKNIRDRHYSFGGHYTSFLDFSDPKKLYVTFFSPLKKPFSLMWEDIRAITVRHFSDKKG